MLSSVLQCVGVISWLWTTSPSPSSLLTRSLELQTSSEPMLSVMASSSYRLHKFAWCIWRCCWPSRRRCRVQDSGPQPDAKVIPKGPFSEPGAVIIDQICEGLALLLRKMIDGVSVLWVGNLVGLEGCCWDFNPAAKLLIYPWTSYIRLWKARSRTPEILPKPRGRARSRLEMVVVVAGNQRRSPDEIMKKLGREGELARFKHWMGWWEEAERRSARKPIIANWSC